MVVATLEGRVGALLRRRKFERICEKTQDWPDLVGVLERELDVVETERERVEVLIKLALIQEEHFLEKFDLAAQRPEQALEISPTEERAYAALERCYRRLKQWLDLINTYERHIAETATSATKVELYFQIAQVYADEVGDVDRAIDAYRNIVDLDDLNVPALDALSKSVREAGRRGPGHRRDDSRRRPDDGQQAARGDVLPHRPLAGKKLGDRAQAQERLEMALDLDSAHLPTLSALRTIAVNEADWDRAARYLEQEQLNTQAPRALAKLLVELGKLRDGALGEHDLAIQLYELAIQCDEDCEEAALPLVEEYVRSERWKEAEPLAEMLVKKSKGRDRGEQHTLNKLLGRVHSALGSYEKALKSYQTANQLNLTDQDSIRGIADVSFELKEWATALPTIRRC